MSSGHYMYGVTLTLLSNDGSEDIVLGETKSGSGILVVEEMFTPGNNYTVKADYDHYYPEEVKFLVNETANAVVFRMQVHSHVEVLNISFSQASIFRQYILNTSPLM